MDAIERIKELTQLLNRAGKAYYSEGTEIMPNIKYDELYDELKALEEKTGFSLGNSPTKNVGYEVLSALPKERHPSPMLSLNKTKSVEELASFAGERKCLLSWKMDGLTVVITYTGGTLVKAVTRGNGEIGEVITNNARTFVNLPSTIPYKGTLTLRGEAVISYEDFKRINEGINEEEKYKNPRNLCSGAVRQLNNEITAKRKVNWLAFSLVSAEGVDFKNSREEQFIWLKAQGFDTVDYRIVTGETVSKAVKEFSKDINTFRFPSDGLVILYDDIEYGISLGRTAKFPRNSIAFKWADDCEETTLISIEWSPSRTGLINPIACFSPVELEGTTVSRASVHNVSIVRELKLGIGDRISVYKANMIIPQIYENLTCSNTVEPPEHCPVCGSRTELKESNEVLSLFCPNAACQVKHIKSFTLLASRDALNIEGLSEATLERFIQKGFIKNYSDLFHLQEYHDEIIELEGFGEKSYNNLIDSIERSKTSALYRVIYGVGISGIGVANAKILTAHFKDDPDRIKEASVEELSEIDRIGPVMAGAIYNYFHDEKKLDSFQSLMSELTIEHEMKYDGQKLLEGKSFVITGKLNKFENRNELKAIIEERGGKVIDSVSKKTNYLINNDILSMSSKNKKAKELGIPILTEDEALKIITENKGGF